MMHGADDIGPFEGLIYSTAARYADLLDDDIEDIQQLLRIKVWQALRAYDQSRVRRPEDTEAMRKFVFSCVANRVKDMLKAQSRLNERRDGRLLYTEEVAEANPERFESRYFSVADEEIYAVVEDDSAELPSTLDAPERAVATLLLLDLSQNEIAAVLQVTRARVRTVQASIRVKMSDWAPEPQADLRIAA
jgi:RNA polymerase sigma factor (sigma-70 family)